MKLHIKSKVISIHHKMEILDENNEVAYEVASKALSIHDKTYVRDASGREIAYMHAKVVTLHNTCFIEMADGREFEISQELFHVRDVINIDGLNWQLRGDFFSHDYEIYGEDGSLIATAHKKWVSLHNVFELDVIDEEQVDVIVAVYVVLEHLLAKRQEEAANANSR